MLQGFPYLQYIDLGGAIQLVVKRQKIFMWGIKGPTKALKQSYITLAI